MCSEGKQTRKSNKSEEQADRWEVDGEREDDKRHDPEHRLHGSQVGIVNTRLCAQLQKERNIKRTRPISCHRLETVWCLADAPPG